MTAGWEPDVDDIAAMRTEGDGADLKAFMRQQPAGPAPGVVPTARRDRSRGPALPQPRALPRPALRLRQLPAQDRGDPMTTRRPAPMPESIRHTLRAKQHPARAVACPHCGAAPHRPCVLRTRNQVMTQPHPQRVSAWAQTVACCPTCQVEPTTPCHEDGRARTTVHARRYQEAEETATLIPSAALAAQMEGQAAR